VAQVSLQNVSKSYPGGVAAVRGVSLGIEQREFMIFVGPSGCGKTTTLRMIAGLEEASEGQIWIGDRMVNDVPAKDRDIAMVFQNYALYPHMTVFENMAFGLKLRKYPKAEIVTRVSEAAEILGIKSYLNRRPRELSGGERQRVAVGRAIVRKPLVFLFDEPLSNLDAKLRVQMRTEIKKLHLRLQTTMIYVTHDQVEAMTMGDRIVVMKDGIIQQIDTPLNLYNRPTNRFVAGFIGSPSMNFLEGTFLQNKDNGLIFDEGSVTITISQRYEEQLQHHVGKKVIFGIRPEDIFDPRLSEGAEEKSHIRAGVEVVEPMGNETLVYLSTNTSSLVARLDAMRLPKVGEEMALVLDISRSHFFDSETEEALL